MSRHCTPDELMDVVDGIRSEASLPHLAVCLTCREELRTAREALAAIRDVDVPEPPPFALEQLSARVRARVAAERDVSVVWGWLGGRAVRPVLAACAVLVVCAGFWATSRQAVGNGGRTVASTVVPSVTSEASLPSGAPAVAPVPEPAADSSTAWMFELADAVGARAPDARTEAAAWDDEPVPAGVSAAGFDALSPDEQREVARLIREAMGSPGA